MVLPEREAGMWSSRHTHGIASAHGFTALGPGRPGNELVLSCWVRGLAPGCAKGRAGEALRSLLGSGEEVMKGHGKGFGNWHEGLFTDLVCQGEGAEHGKR